MKKNEINYPCRWSFKVFGQNREEMKEAVKTVMGPKEYALTDSKKKGKYLSLNISIDVDSELERNSLFSKLKESPYIVMVL